MEVPFIAPGRIRGPQDYPVIGSEVVGTVAGYAHDQLRVILFDPRTRAVAGRWWPRLSKLTLALGRGSQRAPGIGGSVSSAE